MKRTFPSAFVLALSLSVSSLALAADYSDNTMPDQSVLSVPPGMNTQSTTATPRTRYVPSVPARNASDASTAAPITTTTAPKAKYVPSVPARRAENAPVADAVAAPVITKAAPVTPVMTTAPKAKYTPSVAARKPQPAPQAMAPISSLPPKPETNSVTTSTTAVEHHKSGGSYTTAEPATSDSFLEQNSFSIDLRAAANSPLGAAMAKAYNFNPELASYRSRAKAVDEQVPQAYAGWLPSARADYSYGYDKEKLDNKAINGTHPENKSLSVSQPLFNGGETLARTDRAYNSIMLSRAQLTDAEQRVLNDAVKAYMDLVRTDEILKLSINNEQVLKEQLQATRDRFKLGETTHTDVAQSESRLARATSDRVKAAGDYDVAKAAYLRVIGEKAPTDSALKMPTKLPPLPKTLEDALTIGLSKNPNMVAADANRNIAENDIEIAQSALLPDVSLRGSRSEDTGLNSARGFSAIENSYTLNATIPIYQGGAEYSRVRQGKRTRQQRKEEYEDTRNATVQSITSRWRDIETARASIISNKAAVDSATVALNGVRQEADVGTRTTLDVLDAEQELFVAKVNLVTAESKEVLAVYELLSAIGALTASDLALNVEVYDPTIHERSVRYRVIGF